MDRINVNNAQPLNQLPTAKPAPGEAAPPAPAYQADSFSRVRTRTPEQASGMKPLDTAGMISIGVGAAGVLGGLGVFGAMLMGALAVGPATILLGAAIAALGAIPLGLGLGRFLGRRALLDEG